MDLLKNPIIGADIELFVQDRLTKEIVSAEGLIQGTKDKPFVFDPSNKFFATTLDNVLAEFSIPPASNREAFYKYIQKSIGYINSTIPKHLCTVAIPAANLDPRFLQTEHAKLFGCEPDYNAYTGLQNNKPYCADATLRSAGGHLHFGYDDAPMFDPDNYSGDEQRCNLIKAADLHIGVPSIIMEPDNKRKELYGKAGCFRPKSYGVEYRTVSNFYLKSKQLTMWAFDAAKKAVDFINKGGTIEKTLGQFIADTINNNDKENAKLLIKEFKLNVI